MGILRINAKCSDLCGSSYEDKNGNVTESKEYAYVPYNIGIGGGDYVELDIDTETGKILNWKPVSDEKIIDAIKEA
jgi:hypothetical protein